jgi:hypothetical protein
MPVRVADCKNPRQCRSCGAGLTRAGSTTRTTHGRRPQAGESNGSGDCPERPYQCCDLVGRITSAETSPLCGCGIAPARVFFYRQAAVGRDEVASLKIPDSRQRSGVLAFLWDRDIWVVNLLGVASFVELIIFRLVTAHSRPLFPNAGNFADLGSDLSVGYFSAWIFYYLVSWRPQRRTRNAVLPEVVKQLLLAANQGLAMLKALE